MGITGVRQEGRPPGPECLPENVTQNSFRLVNLSPCKIQTNLLLPWYSLWRKKKKKKLDILRHMTRAERLLGGAKFMVSLLEIRKETTQRNTCFLSSKEFLIN